MDTIDETAGTLELDNHTYAMNELPPGVNTRACLEGLKIKLRSAKDRDKAWKMLKAGHWPMRKRKSFPAGVAVLAWLTEVDIDTAWARYQELDKRAKRVLARHPAAKVVQLGGLNAKQLKAMLVTAIDEAVPSSRAPVPPAPTPAELAAQPVAPPPETVTAHVGGTKIVRRKRRKKKQVKRPVRAAIAPVDTPSPKLS